MLQYFKRISFFSHKNERRGKGEREEERNRDIFERIDNIVMEDSKSEICRTGQQAGKIRQESVLQL